MSREIRAAIFDMDGTLLDTMPYWRYTTLEFLLAHGIPFTDEDLVRMKLNSSRRLCTEILEREGHSEISQAEMIREMEGYMNRHYLYDARLKPDVPALLEAVKALGIPMCVATGSPREYARNGLRRLGILDYFTFVTDNYENGIRKGEPGFFELMAERLGTTADRCVVVEDALYSIVAAKAAGCAVLGVEDGSALLQRDEIRATADRYVTGYADVVRELPVRGAAALYSVRDN